jgi:hypothetical protein
MSCGESGVPCPIEIEHEGRRMVEVRRCPGVAQCPVRQRAAGGLDHGGHRKPQARHPARRRQGIRTHASRQTQRVRRQGWLDGWPLFRLPVSADPVRVEGVDRPFAGRRKIQFHVPGPVLREQKGLEAGVPPEPIGCPGRGGRRDTQGRQIAGEVVVEPQHAVRGQDRAHPQAAHGRQRGGGMAGEIEPGPRTDADGIHATSGASAVAAMAPGTR